MIYVWIILTVWFLSGILSGYIIGREALKQWDEIDFGDAKDIFFMFFLGLVGLISVAYFALEDHYRRRHIYSRKKKETPTDGDNG